MHNGLITSLSLYPIKYLNEFFVPYGSSLETNILLKSMPSILITFCFRKSHFFLLFCHRNLCSFRSFLYAVKKKVKNFFRIIWVYIEWSYILL